MHDPLVSVIVPTKNSEAYLERCLQSIINQSYRNIELIVVDNGSSDRTVDIAEQYTDVVVDKSPERSAQRNYGAFLSKGEYLYFVDSDFELDTNVIEQAVNVTSKGFDLVAIHNTSDPSVSKWSKVRKFERDMYKFDTNNIAVRFCSKKSFEKVGGYNEALIALEDYDLHNRLIKAGYCFEFIKPEEVHLGEPKTLYEIYIKHYFYGKTIAQYINTNKDKIFTQLFPIRSGFLKNRSKFTENHKTTFLFFIYLFIKYLAAFNGLVISSVSKFISFKH